MTDVKMKTFAQISENKNKATETLVESLDWSFAAQNCANVLIFQSELSQIFQISVSETTTVCLLLSCMGVKIRPLKWYMLTDFHTFSLF